MAYDDELEDPDFEVLLAEYQQLREDERQYLALSLGLVTVILTVVAALVAVFVVTDTPRDTIPTLVFVLAPMLPIGVFGFVAANAVAGAYRSAYLRDVELKLLAMRGGHTAGGWPVPSYYHGLYELWSRGSTGMLWYIVDAAAITVFASMVALPIWSITVGWLRIALAVVYGLISLYIALMYAEAYWKSGSGLLGRVRRALPSTTPRDSAEPTSVSSERAAQ